MKYIITLTFCIILASCKTSQQPYYKYKSVTPNTKTLNEGEYIKSKQVIKYRG